MIKLLVSDYDGTFFPESCSLEELLENRRRITNFLQQGNIFSFATGRHYQSIKAETIKHDIPYNYLICNNGTSIFDSKDQLIHHNLIPFSTVIKTIKYLNRKHVIKSIKYNDIYGNETDNFTNVAEIVCVVEIGTPEKLEEVKNELNFLQTIYFTVGNSQIHTISSPSDSKETEYLVVKEPSDKKEAIEFISKRERIKRPFIYTVGNDFNDYGMLECYNGFKMCDSRGELEFLDVPCVPSVSELIKRIEG